ncbi:MAG TPA: tetratricopeptide repeat protein [Candidatus Hypogeohydataceae bacterium YC41]
MGKLLTAGKATEDIGTAEALFNKGNSLVMLGRHEEAIKCCDVVLKINPEFFPALYNKGVYLHKMGRLEEAEEYIKRANKIKRHLPQ